MTGLRPHIGRRCGRHILRQRRLVLGLQGALERRALLQALPITAHGIRKLRRQTQVVGQHQGVADRHVGGGEAAGATVWAYCPLPEQGEALLQAGACRLFGQMAELPQLLAAA